MKFKSNIKSIKGNTPSLREDKFYSSDEDGLYMVVTGVGEKAPAIKASQMTIDTLSNLIFSQKSLIEKISGFKSKDEIEALMDHLEAGVKKLSMQMRSEVLKDPVRRPMGASFKLLFVRENVGLILQVGDGEIYLKREGVLNNLSNSSQSSQAASLGVEFENILGSAFDFKLSLVSVELSPGDEFILCSDGLQKNISPTQLKGICSDDVGSDVVSDIIKQVEKLGVYESATVMNIIFEKVSGKDKTITAHNKFEVLKGIPLFSLLEFKEIAKVISKMEQRSFKSNELIIKQGDKGGENLFVILSGSAEVIISNKVVANLSSGDYFGELSLIDKAPRSATIKASEDIEALIMNRDEFYKIITKEKNISIKLLWKLTKTLSRRLREADLMITEIGEGTRILKDMDELELDLD